MKKNLSILLCVVILFCGFSSNIAFADQQVMTSDQFVACLQKALARKTTYINKYPYNLGYYDGTYISWDCWNLGKSIIWSKGTIVDNYTVGAYARVDTSCGLGDWTGLTIIQKAPNCNGDFSNLVPGEWLYMDGHTGYYIGNGQVIECTTGWGVNGVTQSQIDSNGNRSRNGVGNGKWMYHGMVPWISYTNNPAISYADIQNNDYHIQSNSNGLYLVADNGNYSNGNNVSTYTLMENANEQIWSVAKEVSGYRITPRGTNYYLNAYGEYGNDGDNITLWENTNHGTQRWNFEKVDGGYVIRNAFNPNSVLTVYGGNNVVLKAYSGSSSQIWSITPYTPPEEKYDLDVNLTVDGTAYNSGHNAVTFDVYAGDSKVADDVADYYFQHAKGTSYTVKDIRVSGCYTLQGNSSISGTINASTVVTIPIVTQHTPEPIPAQAATCTEPGYTEGSKCASCGVVINEPLPINPVGHQWDDGVVTKEPTVNEAGERTYTCTRCGEKQTGAIPPLPYLPGDINGDGTVNNKDLTRMMKYLAGEDVTVVEAALDVNGDKRVNNKDLTRLMKYLAGEDVSLK